MLLKGHGQINAGVFAYITEINPRRLVVVDVQKGLAVPCSRGEQCSFRPAEESSSL